MREKEELGNHQHGWKSLFSWYKKVIRLLYSNKCRKLKMFFFDKGLLENLKCYVPNSKEQS